MMRTGIDFHLEARLRVLSLVLLAVQGAVGCNASELDMEPGLEPGLDPGGVVAQDLRKHRDVSRHGRSRNGLSNNGLTTNGLTTNGLSTEQFQDWFAADPVSRSLLMKYLVLCAVPAGQVRTYRDPSTRLVHVWEGLLGLAPMWSSGTPSTEAEQQVVSGCLAAHANKYGLPIPISVMGRSAIGVSIPYSAAELKEYGVKEASFFGNLFTGEGIYVCNQERLSQAESSARACGFSAGGNMVREQCSPLLHLGDCSKLCQMDESKAHYSKCYHDGKFYLPISTRLRPAEIYTCGDGICQFTEQCGSGMVFYNCQDCGPCR